MEDKKIEYIKTSEIKIEPQTDDKMMLNLDGEYGGDAPITLLNLKNHIEMFANLDEIDDDNYIGDETDLMLEEVANKFAKEVEKSNELEL